MPYGLEGLSHGVPLPGSVLRAKMSLLVLAHSPIVKNTPGIYWGDVPTEYAHLVFPSPIRLKAERTEVVSKFRGLSLKLIVQVQDYLLATSPEVGEVFGRVGLTLGNFSHDCAKIRVKRRFTRVVNGPELGLWGDTSIVEALRFQPRLDDEDDLLEFEIVPVG